MYAKWGKVEVYLISAVKLTINIFLFEPTKIPSTLSNIKSLKPRLYFVNFLVFIHEFMPLKFYTCTDDL